MTHFKDVLKVTESEFSEILKDAVESPVPILVVCNDIAKLIGLVKKGSDKIKSYDTYYQENINFSYLDGLSYDDQKNQFNDYCNYFDKHKITQLMLINKKLYNYSKNTESLTVDYPEGKKMFLVVENFNFWDFNSQYNLGKITERNKNIIVIGQIRDDFDFAANHIDNELKLGVGGGIWVSIE